MQQNKAKKYSFYRTSHPTNRGNNITLAEVTVCNEQNVQEKDNYVVY